MALMTGAMLLFNTLFVLVTYSSFLKYPAVISRDQIKQIPDSEIAFQVLGSFRGNFQSRHHSRPVWIKTRKISVQLDFVGN